MAEHELDEALRGRLRALADGASPTLDELARRRVIAAVREEAGAARVESGLAKLADDASPTLDDAARSRVIAATLAEAGLAEGERAQAPARPSRWRIGVAAGAVLAAAAAALLVFWPSEPTPSEPTAQACAAWEPAGESLAQRGSATGEGDFTVRAPDGCTTEILLEAGRVDVHARDLGDGVLRVLAGPATVEVWGTRFTVDRSASAVAVSVTEGHVVVTVGDEPAVHLRGGDSWERRLVVASAQSAPAQDAVALVADEAPTPEAAAPEAIAQVVPAASPVPAPRRRVERSAPPPTAEPPLTTGQRFARAERLWREGERDQARALFREVGAGRGRTAEAAWVRLARLELNAGDPGAARRAAEAHQRRFRSGRLGAEALYLIVQSSQRLGDGAGEARAAQRLRTRYPRSPQAEALASP